MCTHIYAQVNSAPSTCSMGGFLLSSFPHIRDYGHRGTNISLLNIFIIKEGRLLSGVSAREC